MDRDKRVGDAKKRERRNMSQSERERGDGYNTGEICSHRKGNIEECLGGNSSIFTSSSSCPVFSSLIIPQSSCTTSFSSSTYLPICTLSLLLLKYKKAILKTKVQRPACCKLLQTCKCCSTTLRGLPFADFSPTHSLARNNQVRQHSVNLIGVFAILNHPSLEEMPDSCISVRKKGAKLLQRFSKGIFVWTFRSHWCHCDITFLFRLLVYHFQKGIYEIYQCEKVQ